MLLHVSAQFRAGRALSGLALALVLVGCDAEPDLDPTQPDPSGARDAGVANANADSAAPSSAGDASSTPGSDATSGASNDAASRPLDAGAQSSDAATGPRVDASTGGAPDAGQGDAATSTGSCQGGFCSGFEDQTGASLSGAWKTSTPNCSGDGSATLDSANPHSGQRSLRIRSGGGVCNHIFATPNFDLKPLSASLWVRLFVRFESAFKDDHVTFLALHDEVSQKDLRMGGQKQIFMWNRERDDATLPELSPNGVAMSVSPKPGSWHCVEFHLQGEKGLLDTYVDGALVPGLVVDGTGTHDIDGQWLAPGRFSATVTDLRLGWESYGSQPMTLWVDDVSIGDQRSGC